MAINKIAGQTLQNNLLRDGQNLAVETNLLYIDVNNNRVGVNQGSPTQALDVNGNIQANNIFTTGNIIPTANITYTLGNISNQWANIFAEQVNGNFSGNYISGDITTTGTANVGTLIVTGNANITGNTASGNFITTNSVITPNVTSTGELALNSSASGNIVLTPDSTGFVEIIGTNGVVIPYGNTAQRPSPAPTGTLRLNTALDQIEVWDGSDWVAGSGGAGNVSVGDQQITGDGSTFTFTLTQDADTNSVLISINGVTQLPATAYTVSGNSITFAEAPLSSETVDVRFLATATPTNRIYNTSANAAIRVNDTPNIVFTVASANVATITTPGVFSLVGGHSLQLPTYTVAQATSLANVSAGQVIYVSNGNSGSPCLAVYDGSTWKRIALGTTIST